MLENITQRTQRRKGLTFYEALRLGCGKPAEKTACFAKAGARRESYAFVIIGTLNHNELKQAKLQLIKNKTKQLH